MYDFHIHVAPKGSDADFITLNLFDYNSKEDFHSAILKNFPNLLSDHLKCPECGCLLESDELPPIELVCTNGECNHSVYLDEIDLGVVFDIDKGNPHIRMLQGFGFISEHKVHESIFDFIELYTDTMSNGTVSAFEAYLRNFIYDASKKDPQDIYDEFKDNYLGSIPETSEEASHAWLGHWLVDNGLVSVPEEFETSIDFAELASDYFLGGSYWSSDGHIFSSAD